MLAINPTPTDIASGISNMLTTIRKLKWKPDGIGEDPGRSPSEWVDYGVCGFASAYLGPWKITIALRYEVSQGTLSSQRIERWEDGLVAVNPYPVSEADEDQMEWEKLPEGNLDGNLWDVVEALDDDGLRDLHAVIEEVVRYLLDAGELADAEVATEEAAIEALREDIFRWTVNAATEADMCRLLEALARR